MLRAECLKREADPFQLIGNEATEPIRTGPLNVVDCLISGSEELFVVLYAVDEFCAKRVDLGKNLVQVVDRQRGTLNRKKLTSRLGIPRRVSNAFFPFAMDFVHDLIADGKRWYLHELEFVVAIHGKDSFDA